MFYFFIKIAIRCYYYYIYYYYYLIRYFIIEM